MEETQKKSKHEVAEIVLALITATVVLVVLAAVVSRQPWFPRFWDIFLNGIDP